MNEAQRNTPIPIPAAARLTGIPRSTLYGWAAAGHLTTDGGRPALVTVRAVHAASAAAHRADRRAANLVQNRPKSD